MKILMMTNTYKPIVGGLESSVSSFTDEFRKRGHQVLIVAPAHKEAPKEDGVFRVPAIQNFNGTDFSVELPIHIDLLKVMDQFKPEIVHSHHPFLIGDTALRISERYKIPLIFTHHTLYEHYTHYVPADSKALKDFVKALATGYANLCNEVIAPSQTVADLIKERGVEREINVVPTGIDLKWFSKGEGERFRRKFQIPLDSFLIGIVSRVAPEKNMEFLSEAVIEFMKQKPNSCFLLVGDGRSLTKIKQIFKEAGYDDRFVTSGSLLGQELIDAYRAMDLFVFSSHSETQGLVLTEAMAAGVPVVAVDAPGVRDVLRDRENGRLIHKDDIDLFIEGINWVHDLPEVEKKRFKKKTRQSVEGYSVGNSADKCLAVYEKTLQKNHIERKLENNVWTETMGLIKTEIKLAKTFAKATTSAISEQKNENEEAQYKSH